MNSKKCVITGANSGIGYQTALALAKEKFELLLICRTEGKANKAKEEIINQSGNDKIAIISADLSSQKQIEAAARKIKDNWNSVDVLINNAGTWISKRTVTEDGVEKQLAVNHLAYFSLTHHLLPLLIKSGDGRIVNVASDAHFHGRLYLDDINLTQNYNGLRAHMQTKLANVLFTYELSRKLSDTPVTANAVQPGLVRTNIGHKHTIGLHSFIWWLRKMAGVQPEEGAQTSVYLASSNEVKGISGKYWDKCQPKPSSKLSYDEELAKRLWDKSLELTGIEEYLPQKSQSSLT